jgi:hypothetical protein
LAFAGALAFGGLLGGGVVGLALSGIELLRKQDTPVRW